MGRSDPYIHDFYKDYIKPQGEVALLGFVNNKWFGGDLYDLQIGNWNINDSWELKKKYDTIICTRTAYFAKDPEDFIKRCYENLNEGGKLYVDWGLGDHWRFDDYKIGWIKDGEQEYAYENDNFLWSAYWEEGLIFDPEVQKFMKYIKEKGYDDLKEAVMTEVPSVLTLEDNNINYQVHNICLWPDNPQLYTLLEITK